MGVHAYFTPLAHNKKSILENESTTLHYCNFSNPGF